LKVDSGRRMLEPFGMLPVVAGLTVPTFRKIL